MLINCDSRRIAPLYWLLRNLVELHGGTVTAASPGQDQGATFTVVLPLLADKE